MSQENVQVVRGMYEAFHRRDFDSALDCFAPDVLVDASKARPGVGVSKGRDSVNALVASWIASWDEWREEVEEIRDLGGQVLVLSTQRGRGKGTGVEVEARYAMLYDVSGGEITSLRMYRNPAEALEAAGLQE
jgi:ketosteroid isomerase-like protein